MRKTLILGIPGAGKTTRALAIVKAALKAGTRPDRIALVSFTNAAADEARNRACEAFGLSPKELPHFRTIHSLAFRQMGLRRGDVLTEEALAELAQVTGELSGDVDAADGPAAGMNADVLLTIDHYARATMKSLQDAHHDHGGDVDWRRLERFSAAYRLFKDERGLLDFTDMLRAYVDGPVPPLDVDLAIVDEAQDLSPLQRAATAKAFATAEELYEAGDDDQAIHHWAGADAHAFMSLPYAREVLPVSHRLPRSVFNLSQEVVGRISKRYPKDVGCRDEEGLVDFHSQPDEADLTTGGDAGPGLPTPWLMLARTRAQLPELADVARGQGVVYSVKGRSAVDHDHVRAVPAHERLRAGKDADADDLKLARRLGGGRASDPIWHDALSGIPLETREYYLACLRRGGSLTAEPRVRIDTFHGAKGSEANNVLMLTDMTWRTQRGYELDPDSEHRVFYVGVTRTRQELHVVEPRNAAGYVL